ncbi:hypothetical protein HNQ77_004444 [Silvibacterium bohemicum]|uniref:Uncharacterized protein n=1 Tax=Silvibacterium bohemicum TaxID=1577686 RepID=A0A841JYN8_9BACT|nr:hypothetical protein [Silvibacterium bohemicum]
MKQPLDLLQAPAIAEILRCTIPIPNNAHRGFRIAQNDGVLDSAAPDTTLCTLNPVPYTLPSERCSTVIRLVAYDLVAAVASDEVALGW